MIQTTLTEYNGVYEGTTKAVCDICGNGIRWGPRKSSLVPKGAHVRHMLRSEGWKIGKVHKCKKCVLRGK